MKNLVCSKKMIKHAEIGVLVEAMIAQGGDSLVISTSFNGDIVICGVFRGKAMELIKTSNEQDEGNMFEPISTCFLVEALRKAASAYKQAMDEVK